MMSGVGMGMAVAAASSEGGAMFVRPSSGDDGAVAPSPPFPPPPSPSPPTSDGGNGLKPEDSGDPWTKRTLEGREYSLMMTASYDDVSDDDGDGDG